MQKIQPFYVFVSYLNIFQKYLPQPCVMTLLLMLRPLDGLDVNAVLEHVPEGRHLPQPLDFSHRPRDRVVHLLLRSESTDAESVGKPGVSKISNTR